MYCSFQQGQYDKNLEHYKASELPLREVFYPCPGLSVNTGLLLKLVDLQRTKKLRCEGNMSILWTPPLRFIGIY